MVVKHRRRSSSDKYLLGFSIENRELTIENLLPWPPMEKPSTIALDTTILFDRINKLLAQQGEMELPGVTISNLSMKGDAEWLYALADVTGAYSGKVILQFKVTFDNSTKRFKLHDLNLELADDSMFAKMANKFVNSMFGEKLDGKLEEVVNSKFTAMLNDILEQMRNMQLPKGGSLHIDVKSFELHDLKTDTLGLHFVAVLQGQGRLEY